MGGIHHALVDTQGYLLAVKVTAANRSDFDGATQIVRQRTTPGRGLLVPIRFPGTTEKMGGEADLCQDHPLAAAS